MATSKDIARTVGVSQSTVSRALRGDQRVRPETRERVLAASRDAGYSPNLLARSMRTRRTGCVSLVIADITNPLFGQIVRAVERALSAAGLTVVLWDEDASDTDVMADTRLSLVDGVIMAAAVPGSSVLDAALRNRVPVVLINRALPGVHADAVVSEDYENGARAAEYLVRSCGKSRIGLIGAPPELTNARDRAAGFRDGLARLDVVLAPELDRAGPITHESGRSEMLSMLEAHPEIEAVFCVSDLIALGAIDGCVAAGREVPDEMFVVGFNDMDMASWDSYSLTTFSHPIHEMATEALQLLTRRIENPEANPELVRLPNQIVVRRSTAHTPFDTDG